MSETNCELCHEFPPCEKGRCCKNCQTVNCNSRQCPNAKVEKIKRAKELPWYLKDNTIR